MLLHQLESRPSASNKSVWKEHDHLRGLTMFFDLSLVSFSSVAESIVTTSQLNSLVFIGVVRHRVLGIVLGTLLFPSPNHTCDYCDNHDEGNDDYDYDDNETQPTL